MVKRIKKNKYRQTIEAVLDLHGLSAAAAEAELTQFLVTAKEKQLKRLRVITGKGINSPAGRAVLKPLVETWLTEHNYSWRSAKINDGGEGALEIILN